MTKGKTKKDIRILLHDIRSVHNVGSIFRTADGAGVAQIYVSGYTPEPIDRFGQSRKDLAKVALGAEKSIPWEKIENIKKLILLLQKEKFQIIAVEQTSHSVDYKKVKVQDDALIIVGNEVSGITKDILDLCDVVAEIPMYGKKESLNVSVAFGIALFRFLNR